MEQVARRRSPLPLLPRTTSWEFVILTPVIAVTTIADAVQESDLVRLTMLLLFLAGAASVKAIGRVPWGAKRARVFAPFLLIPYGAMTVGLTRGGSALFYPAAAFLSGVLCAEIVKRTYLGRLRLR